MSLIALFISLRSCSTFSMRFEFAVVAEWTVVIQIPPPTPPMSRKTTSAIGIEPDLKILLASCNAFSGSAKT